MTTQTPLTEIEIKRLARERAMFHVEYEKALAELGSPPEPLDDYTSSVIRMADVTTETSERNRECVLLEVAALERCATALEVIADELRRRGCGS